MLHKNFKTSKLLTIFILSIIMVSLTACGAKKVDASQHFTVSFNGYDGYATANLDIDKDAINAYIEDYDKFSEKLNELNSGNMFWSEMVSDMTLTDLFTIKFADSYGNLKNGDVVTVEIAIDEYIAEITDLTTLQETTGVEFSPLVFEYTVEGLEEAQVLDVIGLIKDYIEITGGNGAARVNINIPRNFSKEINGFYFKRDGYSADGLSVVHNNSNIGSLNIDFSKYENVSNGDSVEIIVRGDSAKKAILGNGYVVPEREQFEVSGVGEYISSPDQLTQEIKDELKTRCDGAVSSTYISMKDFKITNYYWGTLNPDAAVTNIAKEKYGLFITYSYESWLGTYYGCFKPVIVIMPDGSYDIEMSPYIYGDLDMDDVMSRNYTYEVIEF